MALDVPNLDDRTFTDIIEDARRLVPVYSEEWTDHNASDPGVTLLELFAWLAESYGYQLNRVTDRHVEKFLTLMGAGPIGPTRATAALQLTPSVPTSVESGVPLTCTVGPGESEPFETTHDRYLTTARIARVVSEHSGGRSDNTEANETEGMYFLAFGERATAGSVMYLGFEGDPFGGEAPGGLEALDLTATFYETGLPAPVGHGDEDVAFEPSVDLQWQYCDDYERWYAPDAWSDLTVEDDGTNRLYGSGTIRLARPDDWTPSRWGVESASVLDQPRGLYWLRAIVSFSDDQETDTEVTGTETADPGYEVPPQLTALSLNLVHAEHGGAVTGSSPDEERTLTRVDDPRETTTLAAPNQRFAFPHRPVQRDGVTVTVGGEPWNAVESFDASGPNDRDYVVDEMAGTVVFGDGNRGMIPDAGQVVVADAYTYGGGEEGNVSATTTWQFTDERLRSVSVTPRGRATGGHSSQSVEEALEALRGDLDTRYRAVTGDDYATIATTTPGLRFGRAHAWTDEHDSEGTCAGQRRVTVVVVPFSTRDRPEPSTGFLRAVDRHLCEHRLLTDRVRVEPPTYVGIGVDVEVRLSPGASVAGSADAVEEALDAFLDPLPSDDGTSEGWPFGRPVYPSELYEAVEAVDGIDCILDVSVVAYGEGFEIDTDGTVHIPDTALVYPEDHDVTVRTDGDGCREVLE